MNAPIPVNSGRSPISRTLCLVAVGLAISLSFSGCTRTVIGGYVVSPDEAYCVWGRLHGAYGRSFVDHTGKTATIRITKARSSEEEELLFRKYRFHAGDLGWDAVWDQHDNLKVVFFEFSPGVNIYNPAERALPTNYIRSVAYHLDPVAGIFLEQAGK